MSKEKKPKSRASAKSLGRMSHGSGVKIADSFRGQTQAQRRQPLVFRPILTLGEAKMLLAKAAKEASILAQARRVSEKELAA